MSPSSLSSSGKKTLEEICQMILSKIRVKPDHIILCQWEIKYYNIKHVGIV